MKQTFRSKTAFVLGWIWMAFVAFNAVDLALRFNGAPSLAAAAVLGALTAIVYLTALRPATVITEEGLLVRNPFRTVFLTWASVGEVNVSHAITIEHHGDQVLRLWTPQASARERAKATRRGMPKTRSGRFATEPVRTKAEQAAAELMAGKTHADWVAQQITERAETAQRRKEEAAPARASWAIDSIVVCVVVLGLVVAAFVA